jgi:hypothetical protein
MRVALTFELQPGTLSDLLIGSLLMTLMSELTLAGLGADQINLTIDGYHATDTT